MYLYSRVSSDTLLILKLDYVFSYLHFKSSLYILNTAPLLNMCLEKFFFQSVLYHFILLHVFHRLVFNKVQLIDYYFFVDCTFSVVPKNYCQISYTFRSRIHFEAIFWKGLMSVFRFMFFSFGMSSCFSSICWKASFPFEWPLVFGQRTAVSICRGASLMILPVLLVPSQETSHLFCGGLFLGYWASSAFSWCP